MCSDAVIGVNCSCYDGYQLVNNQNCAGIPKQANYIRTYVRTGNSMVRRAMHVATPQ